MNKQEYVTSLRELADFIEKKSLLDDWKESVGTENKRTYDAPNMTFYVHGKKLFGEIVGALGTFEKESTGSYLHAITTLSGGANITVMIEQTEVRTKTVVGKKKVPLKQAYLVEAVPEHDEEIVEWKCPKSFVALKGETNDHAK